MPEHGKWKFFYFQLNFLVLAQQIFKNSTNQARPWSAYHYALISLGQTISDSQQRRRFYEQLERLVGISPSHSDPASLPHATFFTWNPVAPRATQSSWEGPGHSCSPSSCWSGQRTASPQLQPSPRWTLHSPGAFKSPSDNLWDKKNKEKREPGSMLTNILGAKGMGERTAMTWCPNHVVW
jgi:predicted pyridoxine 5'-phosphate oxidase superfamily flavin-nucleotide-binding protein